MPDSTLGKTRISKTSRSSGACLACRARKHKCSGERPKCAQCGINKIPCQWPEPRKRGPPKNLMSAMERRLIRTEDVLFALLSHTSDDQVMSALRELQSLGQGTDTARRCNFGTAYWETFPLDSVGQVKAWWRNQASSAAGEHRDLATSAAKTVSNVSPGIAQESDSEYHEDSNNDYREDSLLLATDHDDLAGSDSAPQASFTAEEPIRDDGVPSSPRPRASRDESPHRRSMPMFHKTMPAEDYESAVLW